MDQFWSFLFSGMGGAAAPVVLVVNSIVAIAWGQTMLSTVDMNKGDSSEFMTWNLTSIVFCWIGNIAILIAFHPAISIVLCILFSGLLYWRLDAKINSIRQVRAEKNEAERQKKVLERKKQQEQTIRALIDTNGIYK